MPAFIDRTGETNIATNGQKMTIIKYINSQSIDVMFEDETIVTGKSYDSFKKGKIANPNYNVYSKVGESKIANNGLSMKIIAYRNYDDIDIEFENSDIVTTTYSAFKSGYVKNKNVRGFTKRYKETRDKYLNTTVETFYGACTLVDYIDSKCVVVKFDDDTEVTTDLDSFKEGRVRNPNVEDNYKLLQMKKERIGVESTNNYGYRGRVVEYYGAHNFIVEFDDKTRSVCHNFKAFLNGNFKKPANRLGEKRVMNNGLKAEVIEYNSDDDMTVKFENGIIRRNILWTNFLRGTVSDLSKVSRLGEKIILYNGLKAEIIGYEDSLNIDIKLEDGTILRNKQYSAFKRGGISHPTISNKGVGQLGLFLLFKRAYCYQDSVYYICQCSKCLEKDILSPSEILSHNCNMKGGCIN